MTTINGRNWPDLVFQCDCGSVAFLVCRDGVECANCGQWLGFLPWGEVHECKVVAGNRRSANDDHREG